MTARVTEIGPAEKRTERIELAECRPSVPSRDFTGGTATSLAYDPLDRLDTYNPAAPRRFIYDGVEAAAELDSTGAIQNRYVRGDGADELLVDYSGSGTANRRFTSADERGSIISLTDSSGNLVGIPMLGLWQIGSEVWRRQRSARNPGRVRI